MKKVACIQAKIFLFKSSRAFAELKLNRYLEQRLQSKSLFPLKDFQKETFKAVSQEKQNCFINSCTGSGKTLAYLLPIMNKILDQKQQIMTRSTFKNERQISYQGNQRHGAIIFTLNKQLCAQIYTQVRLLDISNKINAFRIGPISYFSPIVQLLSQQQRNPQPDDQDLILEKIETNLVKCVNWTKTDILITTPQIFYNIMTQMVQSKTNKINPQFFVIDQADQLLQIDQNMAQWMHKAIKMLKQNNNSKNNLCNSNIPAKYLISSSSFPKKIKKIPALQYLQKHFHPLKSITGINKHRLPERLEMKYIQIEAKSPDLSNQQNSQVQKQKLFYIEKILTDPQKKGNRFIIFCNNKKTVEKVSVFIAEHLKLQSISYHAKLSSEQRSMRLYKFMNEQFNVLVSTDLGSRGLDFRRPIHTIIEYDLSENIVSFINRAGRTARNQLPGQIISFVQEKNKVFFDQMAEKNSKDQQFNDLFSRKRSYSKKILKYLKEDKKQNS